ncbi:M15 family metallopeptidase [uncultured Oscillibacter sp.]|uniref:M15 family metallopeptidase n=1 Tax=uncultured Oscillibacter sp. TaxID=876091 RepID=UPI00262102FC|nr:M15 family metallopeptidase [uncultured Oscillibacter sp.]
MKWTKRTAALLLSVLLLLTAAQAWAGTKMPAQRGLAELDIRLIFPKAEEQTHKVPVLKVLPPEEPGREEAEEEEPPRTVVIPDPSPAEEEPERTVVIPDPAPAEAPDKAPAIPAPEPETEDTAAAGLPASQTPSFPEAEDWQLLLVNPWNEMPEDYEVNLKTLPDGNRVDEKAFDDLTAMLEACREAGLRPKICSSYRTMSKQTYLYNNKITRLRNAGYSKAAAEAEAGRWVARPGTSEHQLGLAVDIVSTSYQALTKKQEKTQEQKWLMEHCWEYGFILRYPNEKSEITGIGYEPWHYRYVGRDVALDIRDSGLCMEEYMALREESPAGTRA